MADDKTDSKESKNTKASVKEPGMPPLLIGLAALVVIGIVAFMLVPHPSETLDNGALKNQEKPLDNSLGAGTNTQTVPPEYPAQIFKLTADPSAPKAGDDVTVVASLDSAYAATDWKNNFSYEIWIRQFGNWKITSCYDSPCSAVWPQASQGTLEYALKRHMKSGDVITEPASGSYTLDVGSSVQSGDTLPPNNVSFHDPANPHVGTAVTITASASDVSGLSKVEIYLNNEVKKTCAQKVKIAQCQVSVTGLAAGEYTYYSIAEDTKGNTGTSETHTFTVLP